MKKQYLNTFFTFLLIALIGTSLKAQETCANAMATSPGQYAVSAPNSGNGFIDVCFGGQALSTHSKWYKFVAPYSTTLTVTTEFSSNNTGFSLQVLTGDCNNLVCVGNTFDETSNITLSDLSIYEGETYFIQFDDEYTPLGFIWAFSFGEECSPGDVAPLLVNETQEYCPGGTITLLTDGSETIQPGESYVWAFIDVQDQNTQFLVNIGATYSGDLNADLAAANQTTIPAGSYQVVGIVISNGEFCGGNTNFTANSFIINVYDANNQICRPCEPGNIDASLAGTVVNYCPGTEVDFLLDGTQEIPNGENYGWRFINATTNEDPSFFFTDGTTSELTIDINKFLEDNGLDKLSEGVHFVYGIVSESGNSACVTPNFFTLNVLSTDDAICETTAINNLDVHNFSLYPNPNTGQFVVTFETINSTSLDLTLYSMIGTIINKESVNTNNGLVNKQYNLSNLSEGIYFLEINDGKSKKIEKLIISK